MIKPGLTILRDPLRIVAAGLNPEGVPVGLEFQLTPEQGAEFSIHLARAAAGEVNRIAEFDAEFLAAMKVTSQPCAN